MKHPVKVRVEVPNNEPFTWIGWPSEWPEVDRASLAEVVDRALQAAKDANTTLEDRRVQSA